MSISEIIKKITGISTPLGGISWQPSESDKDVAKRVINFLENRRVLYSSVDLEIPEHCVKSVIEIREFLTKEISNIKNETLLNQVKQMRSFSIKFMDDCSPKGRLFIPEHSYYGNYERYKLCTALGEFRGKMAIVISRIATLYDIELDEGLRGLIA